jgi:hypothetical protein
VIRAEASLHGHDVSPVPEGKLRRCRVLPRVWDSARDCLPELQRGKPAGRQFSKKGGQGLSGPQAEPGNAGPEAPGSCPRADGGGHLFLLWNPSTRSWACVGDGIGPCSAPPGLSVRTLRPRVGRGTSTDSSQICRIITDRRSKSETC